jgi:hypothetical protein
MFYDRFEADEILQWASSKNSYVLFSVPFCFFTQSRDYLSNGNYAICKRGPSPLPKQVAHFTKGSLHRNHRWIRKSVKYINMNVLFDFFICKEFIIELISLYRYAPLKALCFGGKRLEVFTTQRRLRDGKFITN